ncbi:shikimate/quinate 5-dehydrogenase [Burkholderia cenocepacia BC7]|uniref:alanine dehydrogenase n=1 Tax=Burkholderia cenocepacia TaxID=95486 RepID=UPI0003972896|nr:NAD(P)-dependent oxidoreductase [Burkholderia cenocepacia]ERI26700.1 shikimate/quinate 5-dehydrogenase [Burkholderia cenocepacia BC7]
MNHHNAARPVSPLRRALAIGTAWAAFGLAGGAVVRAAGVPAAHVVVLGAGVVGTGALQMAVGLGARVTVLDNNVNRLRQLDLVFANRIATVCSNAQTVDEAVRDADVVIGAVLVPGASAPRLVTRDMIATMRKGAVVVDVAIDQGGCFETSHATTHAAPTFVVDGVVHYCVANMPGAVARTSTFALNNATLGHALALADKGWKQAMLDDPHLRAGLNVCDGHITYEAVALALGLPYVPATGVLG